MGHGGEKARAPDEEGALLCDASRDCGSFVMRCCHIGAAADAREGRCAGCMRYGVGVVAIRMSPREKLCTKRKRYTPEDNGTEQPADIGKNTESNTNIDKNTDNSKHSTKINRIVSFQQIFKFQTIMGPQQGIVWVVGCAAGEATFEK